MNTVARLCSMTASALIVCGCASQGPREPEACPPGLSVYCETYLGKPQRCFCATREDLRDVLEPVQEPY